MPVTRVHKDPAKHTMTVTAEFTASVERVWQIWADPRQLERWWGPPVYPATVVEHDLRPGGKVTYYMTGPEGDKPQGWWRVKAVEQLIAMGMEEGMQGAMGQIDALLSGA